MTNPLFKYLVLPAAQRGYVLERLEHEECVLLDVASTEAPDTDRGVWLHSQAEALAGAQALLEDVTKLSYGPRLAIPIQHPVQHPVEAARTALVRTWVLCPKHERDALVREFRVLFREVNLEQDRREVYGKIADWLEAIAEGLT